MLTSIGIDTTIKKRTGAKKPAKKPYFDEVVQDAIIDYNNSADEVDRNRIYRTHIHPALDKLAENLINNHKFDYFVNNDYFTAKHKLITFLAEKLDRYEKSRGKAFSYFDRIGLNFLIFNNQAAYSDLKQRKSIAILDYNESVDPDKSIDNIAYALPESEISDPLTRFMPLFCNYMERNMKTYFKKQSDIKVAMCIINYFKISDTLIDMSKKAFYYDIKETTRQSTLIVTKVLKVIKNVFYDKYNAFLIDEESWQ